jgi:hypothetical protein
LLVNPPRDLPIASWLGLLDLLLDVLPAGSGAPADFLSFDPPPGVQLGRRDDLRGDVGGRGVAGTGCDRVLEPDRLYAHVRIGSGLQVDACSIRTIHVVSSCDEPARKASNGGIV